MLYSRNVIENAIQFWGAKSGHHDGLTLPPKTGKLIEVLATMNWFKHETVELVDDAECAKLIREASAAVDLGQR